MICNGNIFNFILYYIYFSYWQNSSVNKMSYA